jgi:hypothetical protein
VTDKITDHAIAKPSFVLLVGSIGCAMTVLDANITAVVLPTIARDLGPSFADVEWVISTYTRTSGWKSVR